MIPFVLIILELIILYFLGNAFIQSIYKIILILFRSRSIAMTIVTLFLFPGTVIHELSHLFTAEIVGVHTGKLTLAPDVLHEQKMSAGSVMIAQTDPFRRTLIGLSPLFTGLSALWVIAWLLPSSNEQTLLSFEQATLFSSSSFYLSLLLYYLLFAVSTSMFSSKEDMKGVLPVLGVLLLISLSFYFTGIFAFIPLSVSLAFTTILQTLVNSLGLVLLIQLIGFLLLSLLISLLQRIFQVRVR